MIMTVMGNHAASCLTMFASRVFKEMYATCHKTVTTILKAEERAILQLIRVHVNIHRITPDPAVKLRKLRVISAKSARVVMTLLLHALDVIIKYAMAVLTPLDS